MWLELMAKVSGDSYCDGHFNQNDLAHREILVDYAVLKGEIGVLQILS